MKNTSSREAGDGASLKSIIRLTELVYLLQSLAVLVYFFQFYASVFVAIPAIVAAIINHIKRDDVQGTLVASHFRWQIRTFWFGLLWLLLAAVFLTVWIVWIWVLYRTIRGWLALNENRAMYVSHYRRYHFE